jgi:Flp pilus assembly protein TadG
VTRHQTDTPILSKPSPPAQRSGVLGRLWGDTRGAAAVEFAVMAPVLLLALLATIELGRAVNMDRQFTTATQMAGDLVAREEYLGTSSSNAKTNLDSMMLSIKHVMQPYDSSSLKLGVISVRASTADRNDTKVEWSYAFNGASVPGECMAYSLPSNFLEKGGSTIVVVSTFTFTPLFGSFIPGIGGTWTDKSYHTPRNSCVDYVKGDNCTLPC